MLAIARYFDGFDVDSFDAPKAAVSSDRLLQSSRHWTQHEWARYIAAGFPTGRSLDFRVSVPDQDGADYGEVRVRLVVDEGLVLAIADIALTLGAPGMVGVLKAVADAKGRLLPSTLDLVLSAHQMVERFLSAQLSQMEAEASAFASRQLAEMKTKYEQHEGRFEERSAFNATTHVLMMAPQAKASLYALLTQARGLHDAVEALQPSISERDRKDGADPAARARARKREPYRDLLYRRVAEPQRRKLAELARVQDEIFKSFPPALAIIGDVEGDLKSWMPPSTAPARQALAMTRLEEKYDTLMWRALKTQKQALATVERSLANRSVPAWAAEYFDLDAKARRAAGSLVGHLLNRLLAPPPGPGDALWSVATRGPIAGAQAFMEADAAALRQNRVLARGPLLAAMANAAAKVPATTLDALLLGVFRRDLERAQRVALAESRASAATWHRVELVLAVGGLLVGLATLPFGAGESILPASLGWLGTLIVGALVAGSVVVLVRTVMRALAQAWASNTRLRDRLIELGTECPEALEELANFAALQRDLVGTLALAAVEELVELAAQRLLPPLAFAMDLRDHFQAMDSVSEALAAASGGRGP